MKRCLWFFAGIFLLLPVLSAQDSIKTDYVWIFGNYDDHDTTTDCCGSSFLDFNSRPPSTYEHFQASGWDFDMYLANSSYSNEEGELLMYTDGTHIYDPEGYIIPNGDSLSPSWWHWNSGFTGQSISQGHFFLDMPGHPDTVWLFHQGNEYDDSYEIPFTTSPVYFTKIYMHPGTDSVHVTNKNNVLEYKTDFYAPMTATRHANGSDWWIIVTELDSRAKRLYLLTSEGITLQNEQFIGPEPVSPYDDRTYIRQNVFSPNGQYFIRYRYYEQDLQVYSFNRCIGMLSLYDSVQFPIKEDFFYVHSSFSPNSRFIYANRGNRIVQLDLWAEDLASSMDTIAATNPDSFFNFEYHQLAPNGKIYINESGQSPRLHVIHKPNRKGAACDFEVSGVLLPNTVFHSMPHFPYYRLGALEGSPCDTLTAIDRPPQASDRLTVYPVPSHESITIEGLGYSQTVFVYNIQGRLMDRFEARATKEVYPIDHLPAGMYWIRTQVASAKFIKLK